MKLLRVQAILALAALRCAPDGTDGPCRSSTQSVDRRFVSDAARLSVGCGDFRLDVDDSRQVNCLLIDARHTNGDCTCDAAKGRADLGPEHTGALDVISEDPLAAYSQWNCFCEIPQLTGRTSRTCPANGEYQSALEACQCQLDEPVTFDGVRIDGWCYIDANMVPPVGNPDLVADCPEDRREQLRFLGDPFSGMGHTIFIMCQGGDDNCVGMH